MLTKQLKSQWLKELRDPNNTKNIGNYFSAHYTENNISEVARKLMVDPKQINCMCALGCLVKVANLQHIKKTNVVISGPYKRTVDCIFDFHIQNKIIELNDIGDRSLVEIADWIEENCEAV